jgi:protein phosphatase
MARRPGALADVPVPIDIPPDALVLLIGPAGAGKSTWAAGTFAAGAILSSDDLRARVAGDPADQAATGPAFRLLHAMATDRLRQGLLTVVDATNLLRTSRRSLSSIARRFDRPVVAVVFDVPLELCLERNARRPGRRVPDEVVRHQHRLLGRAMVAVGEEGYASVHRLVPAQGR